MADFLIIYLVLVIDRMSSVPANWLWNLFSPNKMTKIKVITRVTGINYNCHVFFFFFSLIYLLSYYIIYGKFKKMIRAETKKIKNL